MDPGDVAKAAVETLTPALPYLLGLADKAAEKASEKIGEEAWEKAKKVWGKLFPDGKPTPQLEPDLRELAENHTNDQDDTELTEIVQRQIARRLGRDEAMLAAIAALVDRVGDQTNQDVDARHSSNARIAGKDYVEAPRVTIQTINNILLVLDDQAAARNVRSGEIKALAVKTKSQLAEGASDQWDLRGLARNYLQGLIDQHYWLKLSGRGIDGLAVRLPVAKTYVPLRAFPRLPDAEQAFHDRRDLRISGRALTEEEQAIVGRLGEPVLVSKLVADHSGLVILGDPGAGKSTFLQQLALRIAEGNTQDSGGQFPLLLPISAFAQAVADDSGLSLSDFIPKYLERQELDSELAAIESLVDTIFDEGRALVLLDGLDEVRDESLKALVVQKIDTFLGKCRRGTSRVIMTSRIIGYMKNRPKANGWAECTLVDFDDEQIEQFVEQWTLAVERTAQGDTGHSRRAAEEEKRDFLEAVFSNRSVHSLATNPLMLSILALMKRQGLVFPRRRVALYAKAVTALIETWPMARSLERQWAASSKDREDVDIDEKVRFLASLALWMHSESPGVGDVPESALLAELEAMYEKRELDRPAQRAREFLEDIRAGSGLLIHRGEGRFGFLHLTFQEYLAALAIARKGPTIVQPIVDYLVENLDGGERWTEVAILTIGHLSFLQGREEAAAEVIAGLCEVGSRSALVAGRAVAAAWPEGVTNQARSRTRDRLIELAENQAEAADDRITAGHVLGEMGTDHDSLMKLKDMEFCFVPAGPFQMGSNEDEDPQSFKHERPRHRVNLQTPYWLGRFPVTRVQFDHFVEDGGYDGRSFWEALIQAGEKIPSEPRRLDDEYGLPNHPAVGISFFEADAYCRWLTGWAHSREFLPTSWEFRLPSEAEWEKAARGGERLPKQRVPRLLSRGLDVQGQGGDEETFENPRGRRIYPWEGEVQPFPANVAVENRASRLARPGCFSKGAGPYGSEDLSGNVWEWTRSLWGTDHWRPDYKYPYEPGGKREDTGASREALRVVRGGSFYYHPRVARCAVRDWNRPRNRSRNVGFRLLAAPCL